MFNQSFFDGKLVDVQGVADVKSCRLFWVNALLLFSKIILKTQTHRS
jgi:hypothetical protein